MFLIQKLIGAVMLRTCQVEKPQYFILIDSGIGLMPTVRFDRCVMNDDGRR